RQLALSRIRGGVTVSAVALDPGHFGRSAGWLGEQPGGRVVAVSGRARSPVGAIAVKVTVAVAVTVTVAALPGVDPVDDQAEHGGLQGPQEVLAPLGVDAAGDRGPDDLLFCYYHRHDERRLAYPTQRSAILFYKPADMLEPFPIGGRGK